MRWLRRDNWAHIRSSARGHLPALVRTSSTTIIGAGAVGSQLAELLVRGGVSEITAMDGDVYEMGTCVRHTLSMRDVGRLKAAQLAQRLNLLTPFVRAHSVAAEYPSLNADGWARVDASSLIVDCTGSDDVLAALGERQFSGEKWFWSISLGRGAKRAYVFSCRGAAFPAKRFLAAATRWLAEDVAQHTAQPLVREGPGCWHPVFPAGGESVSIMVASALRHLADVMQRGAVAPRITLFEATVGAEGDFAGLVKVVDEQV
jgi:hypothetical protein